MGVSMAEKKADGEAAVSRRSPRCRRPTAPLGERLPPSSCAARRRWQPATWYGMPGYAKDGKTVCFFRADKKYMTFGFTQEANLTREEGAPQEDKEKTTDRGGSEFVYRASRRDSCFVDTHTLTHSLTH